MFNILERIKTAKEVHNKQKIYFAVGIGTLVLLIVGFCFLGRSKEEEKPKEKIDEKAAVYDVTNAVEDKSYWVFESERKLAEQSQQQEDLLKQIDEIKASLKENISPVQTEELDYDELKTLREELAELREKLSQQEEPKSWKGENLEPVDFGTGAQQMPLSPMGGIFSETITLEDREFNKKTQHIDNYIPANSYAKAVILSGVDVSTGVSAQSNPQPVLLRLVDKGNLPNHMSSELRDCRVSAGAYGDHSSERAFMRLEKLTCVEPDGNVVETDIEGYVSGEDGKNGVRGRMVLRDGEVLKRGFMGGLLSGLGKATAQSFSTTAMTPLGATNILQGADILKNAGAQGVGDAFELLARYNIQRAEQYQPVIQVNAGRVVEVVFHSGSKLGEKRHKSSEEKPAQSQTDNIFRGLP